jgi:Chaperone of endosialidase
MPFSTVPFIFSPNTLIQSAQVNADFASLVSDGNNIDASQITTGILPIAQGGTGASTAAAAATSLNVLPLTGGTLTGPGNLTVNGLLTAQNITVSSNEVVNGNATVNGLLTATNINVVQNVAVTGAVNVGTTLSIVGATSSHNVVPYSDNAASVGLAGTAYSGMWAYGFTTVSDQGMKGNIGPLPPGSLDMVQTVMPHTYTMLTGPDQTTRHAGFIAQEVYQGLQSTGQVGGYVLDKETGIAGLAYAELVAVLWGAVQELTARVKALEAADGTP